MKKLILIFVAVFILLNVVCGDDFSTANKDKKEVNVMTNEKLIITVTNDKNVTTKLSATLAENSSTKALVLKLKEASVTIDMHDYSNFEKVGEIPFSLPRSDENFSTDAGDLILYLGKRFVIYYDKNEWDFTRIGWLDGIKDGTISKAQLKKILGDGNCKAELKIK